ncbi:MAG: ABC transporter permease [Chloroflexota bacterium]|nr:ABC transporter permease [Chloroflexota bacterium]
MKGNNRLNSTVRTVNRSSIHWLRHAARSNPTMIFGIGIIVVMVMIGIFAPLLFTGDPNAVAPHNRFVGPSQGNWFGTDVVGRDVYSRTIYGSRVSLVVAVAVSTITIFLSVVMGLLVGYYQWVDMLVMRVMDGLMSIPAILLAIALMAVFGGSVQNVIIALCIVETPRAIRVVRSAVLGLKEQMFVDAAKAIGAPTYRILSRHLLPNIIAPLIVLGTFIAASAVLLEAYVSFLGAGVSQDTPTWGSIMAQGRQYLSRAVWIIFFPGVFLTLTVLGINIAGDGLRDNLDPKLRRRM